MLVRLELQILPEMYTPEMLAETYLIVYHNEMVLVWLSIFEIEFG